MPGLGWGFAEHQFGQDGAGGDRADATFGSETSLDNTTTYHTNRQPEYIAADWIGNVGVAARIAELTGVARILEVIQYGTGVHKSEYIAR